MSAEPVLRFDARRSTTSAEKDGTYVSLTPQGQRLVERLASETPREQARTLRQIEQRVQRAKREEAEQRKRIILDVLRKEGEQDDCGNFVLLEKICQVLDLSVIETVLLLHEINRNQLEPDDGGPYVYAFFNSGTGEVYVELWERDGEVAR